MTLAVSGTENKNVSYSLTIFACLVNIIQCCLTLEVSDLPTNVTWITFFMLQNSQCIKNMVYSMLKFDIFDTYVGPRFIDLKICCGSKRNVLIRQLF